MKRLSLRAFVVLGLAVSLLLAGVASFHASSHPDGLEYVAGQLGFLDAARDSAAAGGPFAEYATRGVEDERLSGGLAGVVGVVVTGAVTGALVLALRRAPGADRKSAPADRGRTDS